jgi:hypothetical protein
MPDDIPAVKPGYKTTEFWLALVPPVLTILVGLGVLSASQATEWSAAVQNVIIAVGGLLATAWAATHYATVRTNAKAAKPAEPAA